ncbi:MAG: hypothetical protein P0Y66_22440 [Candidatus Kaistia colombiensis]|nr:MAG: hypothetical protein P0Y66_22440 [Kaistia sp.]
MTDKPFASLKAGPSYEFSANRQPKCPHCGSEYVIEDHDAWQLYDENDTHDVDCGHCGREFQVTSRASWTFSTDEQDALDDEEPGHEH